MLTVAEVESLARAAHASQTDKSGRPYTEHLEAVAEGVRHRGGSKDQICAAWLHDALEDGAIGRQQFEKMAIPHPAKRIIMALTKESDEPLEMYCARILHTPGALLVKEADLAHNTMPERLATLDPATRNRLIAKYAKVRELLGI